MITGIIEAQLILMKYNSQ